ncbi:phage tail protein [Pseudomonas guariconensis]|uniref:phage tail protein n=1 Tax=Pseudomonas guariconensis TaxID=1288410 RepID=UPI00366F1039
MGASITLAGESLIAQKQAAQQILDVQRFIFAYVPGLDPSGPVDRAADKPAADRIVYTAEIPNDNAGFVNPNQVVYSLQVGSDVGDWDFNWIGLETAEGVLFAVAYVPLQQKRRNIPPLQLGNNITRNFLVVYDGAQALTGVTIDATTWQHDFTVRLAGIDERERLSNRDVYGRACFFGSALQVEKVGSQYQVKSGTAYVEGIRVQRDAPLPIAPPALPTTAWLDVALQRELSDVVVSWSVVFGAGLADHTDSAGVWHYLVPIADLVSSASLVDRRPVESIGGPLVQHFAARVGDYAQLRARATTKEDVGLGNLPNAKSDDPLANDSEILATTKALRAAQALPLAALPFPTIVTANNRLDVTASAVAGSGGRVSFAAGVPLVLAQEAGVAGMGFQRSVNTSDWASPTLAANATYYLRAQFGAGGALTVYVQKGTDADAVPASYKGSPAGESGGGFDSTMLDILLAKVVTGAAGTVPVVISLANARQLSAEFNASGAATPGVNSSASFAQTFTLNWARRPISTPIYAVVSQGQTALLQGGANYQRTLTVTRLSVYCRIMSDWDSNPASPFGVMEGSAFA